MLVAVRHQQFLTHDERSKWVAEPRPLCHKLARRVEDLNAIVAPIGYINSVLFIDRDPMRRGKLRLAFTLQSPRTKKRPVRLQPHYPAVPGISDIHVAVLREHNIVRRPEKLLVRTRL